MLYLINIRFNQNFVIECKELPILKTTNKLITVYDKIFDRCYHIKKEDLNKVIFQYGNLHILGYDKDEITKIYYDFLDKLYNLPSF